jgi:hypothetical protein
MDDEQPPSKIVTFDVGGKVFKVTRSLIEKHEGSMLSRLVSDTWNNDPNEPVFVDRNSDIFAQVLDYLRHGSVVLPATVQKDMFVRDLDFYGIVPEEGSVKSDSEGWAKQVEARNSRIRELEKESTELELEKNIEVLALYCATKFVTEERGKGVSVRFSPPHFYSEDEREKRLLSKVANIVSWNETNKEKFMKSLARHGLNASKIDGKPHCESTFHIDLL